MKKTTKPAKPAKKPTKKAASGTKAKAQTQARVKKLIGTLEVQVNELESIYGRRSDGTKD